jgi:hypothetical protein
LAAGGRIALTELAAQLNVDLDHVGTAVSQLLAASRRQQQPLAAGEAEEEEMAEVGGQTELAEFVVCAGDLIHR